MIILYIDMLCSRRRPGGDEHQPHPDGLIIEFVLSALLGVVSGQ